MRESWSDERPDDDRSEQWRERYDAPRESSKTLADLKHWAAVARDYLSSRPAESWIFFCAGLLTALILN